MKPETLLGDPVFQLNLLLWMAMEQPDEGYRVRPLFHKWGFELLFIEQPFQFPVPLAAAIRGADPKISANPEPEMVLGRERDRKALYFEAKKSSFWVDSSNADQARGHLLAAGAAFAEVYTPLEKCLLCYVLPEDKRTKMAECLEELAGALTEEGMSPGPHSVHGLAVRETDIVYSWDPSFQSHLGLPESESVVLSGVTEDTNPSPLILIYSDEDHHDPAMKDFYRSVVINQIRATLLCELENHPLKETYIRTPEDILMKTTHGRFEYLGRRRQGSLRKLVLQNVFRRIENHWEEKQRGITLDVDRLLVKWEVPGEREAFLTWLEDRHTRFETSKSGDEPTVVQPDLFEQADIQRPLG